MATVDLAVQSATGEPKAVALTFTTSLTAGDDYTMDNDGRTYLVVRKAAGTASVLTFVTTKTVSGLAVADPTETAATNTTRHIGPFPVDLYGTVLAISGITNQANLSLAAVRFG